MLNSKLKRTLQSISEHDSNMHNKVVHAECKELSVASNFGFRFHVFHALDT